MQILQECRSSDILKILVALECHADEQGLQVVRLMSRKRRGKLATRSHASEEV